MYKVENIVAKGEIAKISIFFTILSNVICCRDIRKCLYEEGVKTVISFKHIWRSRRVILENCIRKGENTHFELFSLYPTKVSRAVAALAFKIFCIQQKVQTQLTNSFHFTWISGNEKSLYFIIL